MSEALVEPASQPELGAEQWGELLESIEGPTHAWVARGLAEELGVAETDALEMVDRALNDGTLVEQEGAGAFPWIEVAMPGVESQGDGETETGVEIEGVPYRDLWYIKLIDETSKRPLEKWGGYSQDYESAANVYSHDQVLESDHRFWGVVGINRDGWSLLIFDIDIHKAPDGFDRDSVRVPTETPVVRSQSGGTHVWFVIGQSRGGGKESDFEMAYELGFDIDIRGSYVSHHVVAPADIPGVGGKYEVVNDDGLYAVQNPGDAADRIRYLEPESEKGHGEPLLKHRPHRSGRSYGSGSGVEIDRDVDPPDEMPMCYHRGLQARAANPDGANVNTHAVNVSAALCGLAAGYSIETMVTHFCEEFPPGQSADEGKTRYQLNHIVNGGYSPPTVSTLRDCGILEDGETCDCPVHGDGGGAVGDREPVALLPELENGAGAGGGIEAANAPTARAEANAWDWRGAAERQALEALEDGEGVDDPDRLTRAVVRNRVQRAIEGAITGRGGSLIEALPTTGKSYNTIEAVASTGMPTTVATGRGREEQYEQFREWAEDRGLRAYILPSFAEECPTATGEFGEEWEDRVMGWYERGATAQEIHAYGEYVAGEPLPCQYLDGQECPYTSQWRFEPENFDVLIGHYTHLHVPKVTVGRAVVIDESPVGAYETTLGGDALREAINRYLEAHPNVPFADKCDLIENRDDDQRRAEAVAAIINAGDDADDELSLLEDGGHALAPLAALTLLTSDDLGNGWEHAPLDDGRRGVYDREDDAVSVLTPPDLDSARSVVGLDGTPTRVMWETALGGWHLEHQRVLDDDEREEYLADVMQLRYIRTTENVKSYSPRKAAIEDRVTVAEDGALLETVGTNHAQLPALITTARAERVYEKYDVLDLTSASKHYGNILGSNEFANVRVGVVIGARNFGPKFVEKWGAYHGRAIEPTFPGPENDFTPTDYGEWGDRIRTHMREHETLQAVMRFGRDGGGADVYVHTNTLPEWVPIADEGRVVRTRSTGERQVLDAIRDLGEAGVPDIVNHPDVEIDTHRVREIVADLTDRDVLASRQDPDDRRRWIYTADGSPAEPRFGDVELPDTDDVRLDSSGRVSNWGSGTSPYYTIVGKSLDSLNADTLADMVADDHTPSRPDPSV